MFGVCSNKIVLKRAHEARINSQNIIFRKFHVSIVYLRTAHTNTHRTLQEREHKINNMKHTTEDLRQTRCLPNHNNIMIGQPNPFLICQHYHSSSERYYIDL